MKRSRVTIISASLLLLACLSAEHGDNLTLLTVDPSVPNGSQIG